MRASVLALMGALLSLVGCSGQSSWVTDLAAATAAAGEAGTPLRIQQATTFSWNRFYAFGPYTSGEEVLNILGGKWDPSQAGGVETSEDDCLLVFTSQGEVVHSAIVSRLIFDCLQIATPDRSPNGFRPAEAVFEVAPEPVRDEVAYRIRLR